MNICVFCEQAIDEDAVFCPNCGARITYGRNAQGNGLNLPQRRSYQQYNANYSTNQNFNNSYNAYQYPTSYPQYRERTTELTIILVLNYIGIAILAIVTVILFLMFPPIGLLVAIITGLLYWLTYELQNYNNTARIIVLILSALGLISDIITFDIISIVIGIFVIYVLAFHQPTINLFEGNYTSKRNPNPYNSYN